MKVHKASRRRRSYPIHAYIGANGGGKSLCAVVDSLPTLAAGRPVVSTVRLLDPTTGQPHPLWIPLADYRTILDAERCDLILDEVTGVASSRESMGMPPAIANRLVQLRRQDVALRWTAPAWARSDRIIRECSQAVTLCMGFMGEHIADDDGDRLWTSKRLFLWRTYEASQFDEWTTYRKEKIKPTARQLYWRPGKDAERSYDTFDAVLALGAVTEAGTCLECGGARRREQCSCKKPANVEPGNGRRVLTVIPETDDTPAVAVEVPQSEAASGYVR